ncbi:hypothetical protein [Lentimicrobium sp. S6]|uniref:hypothetical protein n=1 Tax=Lentimicrobium sp. S6 TaxID=2735872 RepID=UPI001552DD6E|nr:hypothetical protein [Lentimicrobium sp. S6]NPD47609.1 hypothetical protein [Lentimicrobium sp. S6]
MRRELFKEFNERYNRLNSSLQLIEDEHANVDSLSDCAPLFNDVMDFFNLCAEEYFWKDRLGKRIWTSWHDGMNYWYQNVPIIKKMWDEELDKVGHKAYYLKEGESFFKDK